MIKNYKKTAVQPMRPYVPGEDLTGVSVNAEDTPELGGMIAHNPANPKDQWYIGKKFFEESYEEESRDFGWALKALKEGKKLARSGWNGKGMFIYYVPAAHYPASGNKLGTMKGVYVDDMVPYNEYMAIKNVNDSVSTWVPSINDCFAQDWEIVE